MCQADYDDSSRFASRIGADVREVDIEGDRRAALSSANGRDLLVRLASKVLLED